MSTLLTMNAKAALIGEADGNVRTQELPLSGYISPPGHESKNDEYCSFPRAGALEATDNLSQHILHVNEERVPFQTYADEEYGLSVRAAFDRQAGLWVVADLDSDDNPADV